MHGTSSWTAWKIRFVSEISSMVAEYRKKQIVPRIQRFFRIFFYRQQRTTVEKILYFTAPFTTVEKIDKEVEVIIYKYKVLQCKDSPSNLLLMTENDFSNQVLEGILGKPTYGLCSFKVNTAWILLPQFAVRVPWLFIQVTNIDFKKVYMFLLWGSDSDYILFYYRTPTDSVNFLCYSQDILTLNKESYQAYAWY